MNFVKQLLYVPHMVLNATFMVITFNKHLDKQDLLKRAALWLDLGGQKFICDLMIRSLKTKTLENCMKAMLTLHTPSTHIARPLRFCLTKSIGEKQIVPSITRSFNVAK